MGSRGVNSVKTCSGVGSFYYYAMTMNVLRASNPEVTKDADPLLASAPARQLPDGILQQTDGVEDFRNNPHRPKIDQREMSDFCQNVVDLDGDGHDDAVYQKDGSGYSQAMAIIDMGNDGKIDYIFRRSSIYAVSQPK